MQSRELISIGACSPPPSLSEQIKEYNRAVVRDAIEDNTRRGVLYGAPLRLREVPLNPGDPDSPLIMERIPLEELPKYYEPKRAPPGTKVAIRY